jgi:hypothetical protein
MASAGADLHRRHCDRKRRGATSAEYCRPRDRFRHRAGAYPRLSFTAATDEERERCRPASRVLLPHGCGSDLRAREDCCVSSKPVIRVVSACALAFSREPAVRGGSDDGARRAARRPLGGLLGLRVAGSDASRWKSVGGPARVERERGRLFEAHLGPCRLRPVPARRAVTRACGCEEALFELGRDVGIGARAGRARRAQ